MSKATKVISWLLGLWLLALLLVTILLYQNLSGLQMGWLTYLVTLLGLQGGLSPLLGQLMFWTASIMALLLVLTLLVISFFPKSRTQIPLTSKQGRLTLTKGAIEGLVKAEVETFGYLKNPTVSAKLFRKTVKVDVKGAIIPRLDVVEKAKQLEHHIQANLKEFVGVDQPLTFKITVANTDDQALASSKQRVI